MQDNANLPARPVEQAIKFVEGFVGDAEQKGLAPLLDGLVKVNDTTLSPAELATVQAAVQAYADWGMGDPMARLSYLEEIASAQGKLPPLCRLEIAALQEKLERMTEIVS